jgi:hypothetical protein
MRREAPRALDVVNTRTGKEDIRGEHEVSTQGNEHIVHQFCTRRYGEGGQANRVAALAHWIDSGEQSNQESCKDVSSSQLRISLLCNQTERQSK